MENEIKNKRSAVLSDEQKEILDIRLANHHADPQSGRNWSSLKSELSLKYDV